MLRFFLFRWVRVPVQGFGWGHAHLTTTTPPTKGSVAALMVEVVSHEASSPALSSTVLSTHACVGSGGVGRFEAQLMADTPSPTDPRQRLTITGQLHALDRTMRAHRVRRRLAGDQARSLLR